MVAGYVDVRTHAVRKKRTPPISEFESTLESASAVFLFRQGVDEFFFSHGYPMFYERLENHRSTLERLGLFEMCSDALHEAERLFLLGPEFDEDGIDVLLQATRTLMKASGSYEAMERQFRAANDPSS
jgi:hypothetical protein